MMTKSILPLNWAVPKRFRERLGDKVGRQRAMFEEGHLLLALHRPPMPDEKEREGRFFWRKPDGTWISNELGGGAGALQRHLHEYADLCDEYDRQEEAAGSAEEYFKILDALAPLGRAARHTHQVLQEARKLCAEDRDLINCRDRAYEIERNLELVYSEAKNSLDFLVARRAEEQAEASHHMAVSAHRLNVLAACFFPVATLSAMFGVNLRHGWEQVSPPYPFLTVICTGLVLGALLTLFITRRPR